MNAFMGDVIDSASADSTISASTTPVPISVARGDGIGPELMAATLHVLEAAKANIAPEYVEIGERVYKSGHASGIDELAWASIRRTKVLLKGPITTPQGGGYKSVNVTLRKALGLYANVRPATSYPPFIETRHPKMDLVIIRENEEDLYAGIEHQQTPDVVQCLKLISRPGCEKIVRYAFEYAVRAGRKRVTCMTKDNIMKLTDGLFHKVFLEIGEQYPDIAKDHYLIDIGMARLADEPQSFDVVVMPNLYGDIASDVTAQLAGSVGLCGSANIGETCAMFEAIHGSAPRRAGLDMANPSGLLLSAVMMLKHLNQPQTASLIHNAWLRTIEDGILTYDVAIEGNTLVGTQEFARAVVARLGETPRYMTPVAYRAIEEKPLHYSRRTDEKHIRRLVGVDVFLYSVHSPDTLAQMLASAAGPDFDLSMISNRGMKVWPDGMEETFLTDHWRARFLPRIMPASSRHDGLSSLDAAVIKHGQIRQLLDRIEAIGLEWIKLENLYNVDGKAAYTSGQGD